jgi:hypothetical protein
MLNSTHNAGVEGSSPSLSTIINDLRVYGKRQLSVCRFLCGLQSKIRAKLARLIAKFRAWWRTYDAEERYCWTCRRRTRHCKLRGCLDCDWAERQW